MILRVRWLKMRQRFENLVDPLKYTITIVVVLVCACVVLHIRDDLLIDFLCRLPSARLILAKELESEMLTAEPLARMFR